MLPFGAVAKKFADAQRLEVWRNNPAKWAEAHGLFMWSKQIEVSRSVVEHQKTLVVTSNGVGKDLTLGQKLPTPTGWTTVGDVKVGEYVLDELGRPTKVTGKSRIFYHDLVKVIFDDGAEIICSPNHEWVTLDFKEAGRARRRIDGDWRNGWSYGRTRETREIMSSLRHGKQNQANHYIPINAPIVGQEADLLIDPYILGVWLGDGNSAAPSVTLGPRKKHIPQAYLRASIEQRIDLLRGLMDTDGFNAGTKASTCVGIDFMNEQLALSVVELVRSLGVRCSVSKERTYLNGEDAGTRWRMVFNPTFDPFTPGSVKSLERPEQDAQASRKTVRTIVDVVPVPTEPTQCIEVDSESHMYLAGEHMVPTHNSRLSAMLVNWWVDTHPVDDTTVVTTATNWKQVRNVLWKEIPRVKADAGIGGKVNADATWKMGDRQDPIAFGMKPDDKDESGFQGVHDQYVLVIMDEAGGISKEIFTAADAITTNKFARILAIANPNDPSCYMAEVYKREMRLKPEERSWNIIQFGAYDTPNFTGEVVPVEVATRLVQVDWVEARKKEWGEDDPRFVARVLGEFPDVSDDGLFNMGRVMQSMEAYDTSEPDEEMPITIGVDVARYGSDSSVIVSNQGGYIRIHGRYQGLNGPELARKVGELAVEMGAVEIRIDAIGVGASVLDSIYNFVPPTISVVGIHGNAKSGDSTKWYNYRAAMYDQFAKAVADGRVYLPDDDELHNEIASIKYEYRGSALLIESKENMRKRGIKSPDVLDAVIYAYQNIGAIMAGDSEGQYFSPDDLLDADDLTDFMFEDELAYFIA